MARLYADPVERLLANSVPEGDCWRWKGSYNNVNRPRIAVRIKGKSQWVTVARYIAQFVHGKRWGRNESRRKVGAHTCDNGWCCNPEHVEGSTQKQNIRQCVERGRHVSGFKVARGLHAGKIMEVSQ